MNEQKYLSYTEAWSRVRAAVDADFPFEAVTILESIIADRLLSYLAGVSPDRNLSLRTPFGGLVREWQKIAKGNGDAEGTDLAAQVDVWREVRNTVVHGLVKSEPGTPTEDVSDFLQRAREAAREGEELARAVDAWHKKQLRKSRSDAGDSA